MSGECGKEEDEGESGREKAAPQTAEQGKKPEDTRQRRITWLGLGEQWGVVRDVRMMIYALLTPMERVMVERAHGVNAAFERHKDFLCTLAARRGYLEVLKWARANGCPWSEDICTLAAREGHLVVLQ